MKTNKKVRLATLAVATMLLSCNASAQLPFLNNDPNLVRCESVNSRETTCDIPDGKMAEFARQESQAACTRGQTYEITATRISVTRGCRATFRLSDAPALTGSALTTAMRTEILTALAQKIRADQGFSSTPSLTLQSDRERAVATNEVNYTGTARVVRNGKFWKTVEFESVFDPRSRRFTSLGYRLADVDAGDASQRRDLLRQRLDTAMEAKLDKENRNSNFDPSFELLTGEETFVSTNETAFAGTGRVMTDGNGWRPVAFESKYDWRAGKFTSLSYRQTSPGDDTNSSERMDEDVEAALMRALAEEVRKQKGGSVQAVVNRRFRSVRNGGDVVYTGRFGYSWNDGFWVTRGYEAVFNPSGVRVRSVRIYRIDE